MTPPPPSGRPPADPGVAPPRPAEARSRPAADPARPRRILTKNRMGWSSDQISPLTKAFVDWCAAHPGAQVLDIGTGYGAAARAALDAGARVIANDLNFARLDPHERLQLHMGRFPRHTHFEPESLDAVHISNVLHFLTGRQLEEGFRAIARWLRPGGRLFVQTATPYQEPFRTFIPEFERRCAQGQKWPGYLEKLADYSTHRQRSQMPKSIHLLDVRTLEILTAAAGMEVIELWYFLRHDMPVSLRLDGRETVGLIADRPEPP